MIEIIIMTQSHSDFVNRALDSLKKQNTQSFSFKVAIQSERVNREEQIRQSSADWILFLDEDCYLPHENFISEIRSILTDDAHFDVYGGTYRTEASAEYRIKAYNQLCNAWVFFSQKDRNISNLLGGCLAIKVSKIKSFIPENPIKWGGEETFLLRHLQSQGVLCGLADELSVVHAPRKQSFQVIKNRALLQGSNRKTFHLGTPSWTVKNLVSQSRFFYYWPFWALHFFFVFCGTFSSAQKKTKDNSLASWIFQNPETLSVEESKLENI